MTAVKGYECDGLLNNDDELMSDFFCHLFRSSELSIALEKIFTLGRIKKDCILIPGVTLNCMLFNGYMNLLQRVKETVTGDKENRHVCKCEIQQLLVNFLSKISFLLLTIEVSTRVSCKLESYSSKCI